MDISEKKKYIYDTLMMINLEGWRYYFKNITEPLMNGYLYNKSVKYIVAIKTCLHNRDLIGANKWFNKYKKLQNEVMEKFEDTEDIFVSKTTHGFKLFTQNNEDRYLKICDMMKRNYEIFERYIEILEYKLKYHHF